MKKTILLSLTFGLLSFALPDDGAYTKAQIEAFIREVFRDHADSLVLNDNSNRLALIDNFLSRVEIRNSPEYAAKRFRLLSEIALQNKYNPALKRDVGCNPKIFNPLKYRFPMSSRKTEIFRFDHTDYLIIIHPIK